MLPRSSVQLSGDSANPGCRWFASPSLNSSSITPIFDLITKQNGNVCQPVKILAVFAPLAKHPKFESGLRVQYGVPFVDDSHMPGENC